MRTELSLFLIAALTTTGCGAPTDLETATAPLSFDSEEVTASHGSYTPDRDCNWYQACVIYHPIDFDLSAQGRLRALYIWSGSRIDSIQLVWQDENDPERLIWSERRGGSGGKLKIFQLEPGEVIVRVNGRSGDALDALEIFTSHGRLMRWGGHGGKSWTEDAAATGREIHGFSGAYARTIKLISFHSYLP